MPHNYRIALTQISNGPADTAAGDTFVFEITNHDDILQVIERARQGGHLPEEEVTPFCVGLKLLAQVVTKHSSEPLFAEFSPHLGEFIRGIKAPQASRRV